MAKFKALIASVMCGFSTFTIMPNTNYADFVPQSPSTISKAAWLRTGSSLRKSIDKVGKRIGTIETGKGRQIS